MGVVAGPQVHPGQLQLAAAQSDRFAGLQPAACGASLGVHPAEAGVHRQRLLHGEQAAGERHRAASLEAQGVEVAAGGAQAGEVHGRGREEAGGLLRRGRDRVVGARPQIEAAGGAQQQVRRLVKQPSLAQPDPAWGQPEEVGGLPQLHGLVEEGAAGGGHAHHQVATAAGFDLYAPDRGRPGIEAAEALEAVRPRLDPALHLADPGAAAAQTAAVDPGAEAAGAHLGPGAALIQAAAQGQPQRQNTCGEAAKGWFWRLLLHRFPSVRGCDWSHCSNAAAD